ncbi:hypothetical protein RUM43_006544 [Polyplax serrata]|uniref:PH domain-containing protein n=1 Tax=Polyplax serrata TaxID=468196 RepID=A0AAN8NS91_POLSC
MTTYHHLSMLSKNKINSPVVEINQAGGDVTQVPRPTLWIIPEAGNDFGCLCSQNIFGVLPMGKLPAWLNEERKFSTRQVSARFPGKSLRQLSIRVGLDNLVRPGRTTKKVTQVEDDQNNYILLGGMSNHNLNFGSMVMAGKDEKEEVVKEGFMVKRSQNKKRFTPVNYKQRWFVLTKNYLIYYDGDGDCEICLRSAVDAKSGLRYLGVSTHCDIFFNTYLTHLTVHSG